MTEPIPAEAVHEPVTVAGATPDPAVAPAVDPDADTATPTLHDRWVRFEGQATTTVIEVGEWVSGEVKHVAGWLAERLLRHPHFTEAEPPAEAPAADEAAPVVEVAKPARKQRPADADTTS